MMGAPSRRAFTLVELLVVTGLMAALFGLIVTGLRPNEDSDLRAATQSVVSSLLQAQTRALQSPAGAGLQFSTTVVPVAGGSASIATGLALAIQPPAIVVTATSLIVNASGASLADATSLPAGTSLAGAQANIVFQTPENADGVGDGYRIRFATSFSGTVAPASFSPWFGFEPAVTGANAGIVSFLPSDGQNVSNTVWPVALQPMRLRCEIARRPETAQSLTDIGKTVAIDMRYSGVGDDPDAACGSFHPVGQSPLGDVVLQFGSSGGIYAVIPVGVSSKAALDPSRAPARSPAPIYLLLTPRSLIDANASSLRTDRSVWIAINPATGRVVSGKNVSQAGPPPTLGGSKEQYIAAYRTYFQNARAQVRQMSATPR